MPEGIVELKLPGGRIGLISSRDEERVCAFTWTTTRRVGGYIGRYFGGNGKQPKWCYLHRFIMIPRNGEHVDHIDGNPLNNVRSNLRLTNRFGNMQNRHASGGASPFKGVTRSSSRRNPWRATITTNGVCRRLGSYLTEVEAALAYDEAARIYHGEFAVTNFGVGGLFESEASDSLAVA